MLALVIYISRRNVPYTMQKHFLAQLICTSSSNEICWDSKKMDVSCISVRMFTDVY